MQLIVVQAGLEHDAEDTRQLWHWASLAAVKQDEVPPPLLGIEKVSPDGTVPQIDPARAATGATTIVVTGKATEDKTRLFNKLRREDSMFIFSVSKLCLLKSPIAKRMISFGRCVLSAIESIELVPLQRL